MLGRVLEGIAQFDVRADSATVPATRKHTCGPGHQLIGVSENGQHGSADRGAGVSLTAPHRGDHA